MGLTRSGRALAEFCLAWILMLGALLALGSMSYAQGIPTTQINDTVYRGDGTVATGTVLISWPAFSTAGGASVPAGSTSVTIGAGGALSVQLVPNAGSMPMGSYYTVVYHLDDGSVTREYWVVPVSSSGVAVSTIRSTVLPTSMAMQTVSKNYVDTAIAAAVTGHPLDTSPYVEKSGDTMTGPLLLPGDPAAPLQASDKNYVDEQTAGLASGLSQKVSLVPTTTQVVVQPAGTELAVNILNSQLYASQFATGAATNGIANATASPGCSSGCDVNVEQTYSPTEAASPTTWNNKTHLDDRRGGGSQESFFNPIPPGQGATLSAKTLNLTSTQSAASVLAATGSGETAAIVLSLSNEALAGGSNISPDAVQGTVPYGKTTYSALSLAGTSNTVGQHDLASWTQNCYGVGDCLMGSMYLTGSGGFRDAGDEGIHPFDRVIAEDASVFEGLCAQGCAAGSTVVQVTATSGGGTEGEGRYLMDTNPALTISTGTLTGGIPSGGRQPSALFAGTNFPLSVFLETAQTIPTQATVATPGTVTVPILTSGVPTGFATNTAALPSPTGVACVVDVANADTRPLNFETAAYVVIDGSHVQMTLNRPHGTGATIAVGGMCGYGLEQKVDTNHGIRQVFPVIGSPTATSLLYAGGTTAIVGVQGLTSNYANLSLVVASIARSGNVVTLTTTANFPYDPNSLTMTVQNVADSSYNGGFTVTSTGPNTLTYPDPGPNSTSSGGTVSVVTGGYALYPMAEVLTVYNPATKAVDGKMTLAANTVNWATGDPVEQPHYFQERVADDIDSVTQYMPRAANFQKAGIDYEANVGPGMFGWHIGNLDPASSYFGNGGTLVAPAVGIEIVGTWNHSMEMQAGETVAMQVHCNSHGCGKWNSTYDLFALDSNAGQDQIQYAPATSTLSYSLLGTNYSFGPLGFTAPTINVTTLNAGSVHGLFEGTVMASSLPVFGASGAAHAQGAVPDPGATEGATRFLREDGSWATVLTGGSIGSTGGSNTLPQGSSLLGEYLFTDGSGTVVHDSSGLGNDGTLGSGSQAPAWTSTGLSFGFGQTVALPPAVNAVQTMLFGVYVNPLTTAANHIVGNDLLLGNTVGNTDLQILLQNPYPGPLNNNFVDGSYGLDLFAAGSVTASSFSFSGYHTIAITLGTCGTSLDRLFVDGQELAYMTQQCSAGKQSSGNLLLGGNPAVWGSSTGLQGQLYLAAFYSTALTADQIASASGIVRNAVAARGAAVTPLSIPLTNAALNVAGDSITFGYPNLTPYSALLSLQNPPTTGINNWGISGITMEAIAGSEDNRVGPLCHSSTGPAVYSIFAGTNDFLNIQPSTPQSIFASLTADIQKMKSAGCRVGVLTMISRGGSGYGNGGATFDTDKKLYNALILSGARSAGADFLVDVAAIPGLGADGASANSTYFQADNTHPTQFGQQAIANAYSNSYNYTFGNNKANPNVVSAGTYQMLSSDGAVSLTGTGSQAITMPDCTGPSGAVYYLNNSTSVAKTVIGGASQPINGLTTAIAIPPNSSLALFDVPNPETVSGCHWEY